MKKLTKPKIRPKNKPQVKQRLRMLLIPCSCQTTFAVSENYDGQGMHLRSFLACPNCGKRHDPRNRLLTIDYQPEGFWKVGGC